jgi:predicted MFS family arabinose efflux permease
VTSCAIALCAMSLQGVKTLAPIYAVLALLGTIRAFSGPAGQALMPNLVDRVQLERAVALGSSTWQLAMIAGPSLGGAIYAATGHAYAVYATCAVMAFIAFVCVLAMGKVHKESTRTRSPASLETVLAGIKYVWSNKPILGAISLDLFAVLLGGAVALLPIFAKDLLHIGPWGLGILRSAPAVGAAIVALTLAYAPIRRRAGVTMLGCVLIFGVATIVFGVSKHFAVSLVALLVLGAADMISVVIRSTLIQTRTPDEMRGRVGAVNLVFIGASNELGEFESGVTAAWLGPELAVIVGGVGTCVVVVLWAVLFPHLRDVDQIDS